MTALAPTKIPTSYFEDLLVSVGEGKLSPVTVGGLSISSSNAVILRSFSEMVPSGLDICCTSDNL